MNQPEKFAVVLALAALGIAGAATPGATAAAPEVRIKEFAFTPARLVVARGAAVTWVNDDEETHTVTALDRAYGSAGLEHAETWRHQFSAPGTYTYFCALHPHMTATIVVQ
jgi:plastocyanin